MTAVISLAAGAGCQDAQQCTLWWGTPGAGNAISSATRMANAECGWHVTR